jgi:hypothetical protein
VKNTKNERSKRNYTNKKWISKFPLRANKDQRSVWCKHQKETTKENQHKQEIEILREVFKITVAPIP